MRNEAIVYRLYGSCPAALDERQPLRPRRVSATFRAQLCDDCGWPDLCREAEACQRGADRREEAA